MRSDLPHMHRYQLLLELYHTVILSDSDPLLSKRITGLTVGRWSPNLISCSEEDVVRVWDIASRQVLRTVNLRGVYVTTL